MNQNGDWMKDRDCATQTLDIRGLGYNSSLQRTYNGALRGMDADWMMELHNTDAHPMRCRLYLFAEVKCDRPGARMTETSGQMQALQALCDDLYREASDGDGVRAFAAEAIHTVYDAHQDIDAAACVVERYYDPKHKKWIQPTYKITLADWQDTIIQKYRRHKAAG